MTKRLVKTALSAFVLIGMQSAVVFGEEENFQNDSFNEPETAQAVFEEYYEDTYSASAADVVGIPQYVEYWQSEARSILNKMNEFRTGDNAWEWDKNNSEKIYHNNLNPLHYDYDLEKIALTRAAELAATFSHTRPDRTAWNTAYTNAFRNGSMGENIAVSYEDGQKVFDAWKEENQNYSGQGHRRNMLKENYKSVGIACVIVQGVYYWVQEFSSEIVNTSPTDYEDFALNEITVNVAKNRIRLETRFISTNLYWNPSITMNAGDTYDQLMVETIASINNSDIANCKNSNLFLGFEPDISYSNPEIAVVNGFVLTALAPGDTEITFSKSLSGMNSSVTLKVHVDEVKKNGLIQDSDGIWRLYQNGEVRTNFTGLYPYGTSLFHLTNGVLDKSVEGIEYYQKKPYYVVKGQVTYNYTGLGEYKGSLHYFTKSEKDESFNGIAYYKGEPYFVVNGKVTYNYVGLGEYKGSLHYFTKSKKDTTFTGLSYYKNEPYYVLNGIVSYKYNGLGQYKTDWWYVVNSMVDKSYTGNYTWKGSSYFIKNGKVS